MNLALQLDALLGLLLAGMRVGGWLLLAPPFSHRAIPSSTKVLFSLALALAVNPKAPGFLLDSSNASLQTMRIITAGLTEFLIGSALGFLVMTLFAAVQAAGDILDVLGGFSMAFAFDSLTQTGSAVMGRFYQITALTLMFATNAYLVVLAGLLRTFAIIPVGGMLDLGQLARNATTVAGGLMIAALQIAGPVMAILFLTDVALGLLTRVAPALNVFSLGFVVKILMTLALIGLSITTLPGVIDALTEQATNLLGSVQPG